jgi:hypothetical protein
MLFMQHWDIVCANGRFNILGAAEIDTNPPRSIHLFIGFHAWDK